MFLGEKTTTVKKYRLWTYIMQIGFGAFILLLIYFLLNLFDSASDAGTFFVVFIFFAFPLVPMTVVIVMMAEERKSLKRMRDDEIINLDERMKNFNVNRRYRK